MRMKLKKNLLLSEAAVVAGQKLAAEANTSLSKIVEQRLLGPAASAEELNADYWDRPTKPVPRSGDARFEFLNRKHA